MTVITVTGTFKFIVLILSLDMQLFFKTWKKRKKHFVSEICVLGFIREKDKKLRWSET